VTEPLTRDEPGPRLRLWHALVALVVTRIVVRLCLERAGLFALSDDDFSRVVIAQRFAADPCIDPSGTSWLPLPFWSMGAVMAVFGSSLSVARVWTEIVAVLSSLLLFGAGRAAGLGTGRALVGAWLATVLPASAVLGSVPVPELPTAALSAFALLALSAERPKYAALASLAVLAASLSRYEAWPIAFVVAGVLVQRRRPWAAAIALAGPALWIVHNRVAHGDFFHFLHRVSAYRAALGHAGGVFWYLVDLASSEPVLVATVAMLVVVALRRRASLRRWTVPAAGAAALLLFLAVGASLGGAPTHHVGRTLLVVWLLAAIAAADLAAALPRDLSAAVIVLVAGASALGFARELESTIDRRDEVAAGLELGRSMAPGERAVIATEDYGYFAVQAALGRPRDTYVYLSHDPRAGGEGRTLTAAGLGASLDRSGARWLVAPAAVDVSGLLPVWTGDRLAVYRRR
jgi:hypothetical protein